MGTFFIQCIVRVPYIVVEVVWDFCVYGEGCLVGVFHSEEVLCRSCVVYVWEMSRGDGGTVFLSAWWCGVYGAAWCVVLCRCGWCGLALVVDGCVRLFVVVGLPLRHSLCTVLCDQHGGVFVHDGTYIYVLCGVWWYVDLLSVIQGQWGWCWVCGVLYFTAWLQRVLGSYGYVSAPADE